MKKENIDYSVYLVTDRRNKTDDEFLNIIEEAIKGGTSIVQLREKTASTKDLYKLALRTSDSVALINYIHKATYFIVKVLNDGTLTEEEQLQDLKTYLKEMLESYPHDVKATIKNLKEMLELEEANVPEVLIQFEAYVEENYQAVYT